MKFLETIKETGRIPTYRLEDELELLLTIPDSKPSKKIIKSKNIITTLAGLRKIDRDCNSSWYAVLKKRLENNPNGIALFYRGTKITFQEMFEKSDEVAHVMISSGITKGDTIPVCLSNTPELVYIMLAANKIGAKLNLFSSSFDEQYIKEILSECSNKLFFGTDDTYDLIKENIQNRGFDSIVVISLTDSLPKKPELCDEYEPSLDKYYRYENKVAKQKKENQNILTYNEFISKRKDNNQEIVDDNNLETEFIITYTSGSTKIGRPKQLLHTNRSFITMGVFHDPELCGNPRMPGFRALAHIHSDSNTNLITSISDSLMQQWTVALEPEYDKEKALDYLIINKANQVTMTTSFWVRAAKQYLLEKRHHEDGKGRKLDFLFAGLAAGEKTSKGEEKFINEFLRVARAGSGVKIKGLSLPFTSIGFGGGDCEHGGIYYTLWHNLYEKINYLKLVRKEYGMKPVPFAHISAFKQLPSGEYQECDYNEYGLIAANSAVSMKGYKNNQLATETLIIRDNYGRDWISSNVYGYIDNLGTVHVNGRIGNEIKLKDDSVILPFMIEECIEKDTKNILSCAVTITKDNNIVINIETQPKSKETKQKIILSAHKRLLKVYPNISEKDLYFRIIDSKNSFPLTGSGKRNIRALEQMGLEQTQLIEENTKSYRLIKK